MLNGSQLAILTGANDYCRCTGYKFVDVTLKLFLCKKFFSTLGICEIEKTIEIRQCYENLVVFYIIFLCNLSPIPMVKSSKFKKVSKIQKLNAIEKKKIYKNLSQIHLPFAAVAFC